MKNYKDRYLDAILTPEDRKKLVLIEPTGRIGQTKKFALYVPSNFQEGERVRFWFFKGGGNSLYSGPAYVREGVVLDKNYQKSSRLKRDVSALKVRVDRERVVFNWPMPQLNEIRPYTTSFYYNRIVKAFKVRV